MIAKCNMCQDDRKQAFRVPWDLYGHALMQAHLLTEHGKQLARHPTSIRKEQQ